MEKTAWLLVPILISLVYLAALLATVDGVVRAFQERYLPPWLVGLGVTALLLVAHDALGTPFGNFGALFAIPGGIVAGAAYGLQRRRHLLPA